ncbi:MAG: serine hydrolase domain-containing protein [Gemmatimonadaceae bacterium]
MRIARYAVRSVVFIAVAPVLAVAQSGRGPATPDTSTHGRVDAIFATWDHTDSPGCALGVYRDGRVEYARGYGMANLELGVALSPQSVFDIGSTSKQFTAMSIMLLARDGKLSLDDDIRKYVPELPNYGKTISIRHILTHTSGIRDYLTLWALAGVDDADLTTDQDALDLLSRQRELNFAPGEQWLYSNSGFFLASLIVKRVSGQTLAQFASDRIFRPLGMTHTRFNDDHKSVIPNRATGYAPRDSGSGWATEMSNFEQTGDGAVQTTIEDMQRWDENFYTGAVGGTETLAAMQKVAVLNSGKPQTYALGLMVDKYRGLRSVSHGGSWAGYRAELLRFPDQHLSVACLCNLARTNPSRLARSVAEIYLGDRMTPAPEATVAGTPRNSGEVAATHWTPNAKSLAGYTGRYDSPELQTSYDFTVDNGKLTLHRRRSGPVALTPTVDDSFTAEGITYRFIREKGRVAGFLVEAGRTKNLRFEVSR